MSYFKLTYDGTVISGETIYHATYTITPADKDNPSVDGWRWFNSVDEAMLELAPGFQSNIQAVLSGTHTFDPSTRRFIAMPAANLANKSFIESKVEQCIIDLNTIANSTGTLTGVQLSNSVRVLAKTLRAVVRYQHGRLESSD